MNRSTHLFVFAVLTALIPTLATRAQVEEDLQEVPVNVAVLDEGDIPDLEAAKPDDERVPEVGAKIWYSFGRGQWEIEFGALFFKGRSKLEWEDIDSLVLVLDAEVPITDTVSIGGQIGAGDIDDGTNTDGDWFGDFQVSESMAETSGDVKLGDVNVYVNLINDRAGEDRLVLDAFAGYQYYKDSLTDKRGVQTIVDERPVNDPFPGLNSKYRFEWQMIRIGARATLDIDDTLTVGGSLAYLYLLQYDGEAFWNLRDDYRRQDPNFIHDATEGHGLEGKITMRVHVSDNLALDAGYWFMIMNAENGTDKIYFSDGTTGSSDLTDVQSVRHGIYGGATYRFN